MPKTKIPRTALFKPVNPGAASSSQRHGNMKEVKGAAAYRRSMTVGKAAANLHTAASLYSSVSSGQTKCPPQKSLTKPAFPPA
jgi:hypothetical protein